MEPIELIGGAGAGGAMAAVAYKFLAVIEHAMKRKNGGTDHDSLVKSINNLSKATKENGEELKEIKGLLYDVRAKQEQRDAVERDRALRQGK